MVQTSEGRRWLDRAAAGIRSRPDREAVRAELDVDTALPGGERFLRRAQEGFCLEDGVWLFPLESPEGGWSGDWYEGAAYTLRLYREDGALLLENLPLLEQFGFACEDFGAGALLVREVPADIDAADTVPTLEEFAERLRTGRSPDEKREALLHTMACKAAIKGGWVSDPAELRVLVDRVQSGEIKYCPHGRPVAVKLTKYELEKMFKRA